MTNLNKTVHLFLKELHLENKTIICGFSGGADSTALLHILAQKQTHFHFHLKAVFFSHGNSPIAVDEDKMQQFCQQFCQQLNIEFLVHDLDLQKEKRQSWESSGRHARQNFYEQEKVDYIFLGHHKDDQNETTMIQLMRGAGKGVSAMKSVEGKYCRPFLDINKHEIYSYLKENQLQWVEDPTNTNTDFTRNFWRQRALPLIAKHYPHYSKMLDNFRKKNTEMNELAFEMAQMDGLNTLLSGQAHSLRDITPVRLKNLLNHYFQANHVNMEDAFYEQQVSHYFANKELIIEQKNIRLYLSKDVISTQLPELKKTLKPR